MTMTVPAGVLVLFVLFSAVISCEAQSSAPVINITPDNNNVTLFEGEEFRRVCIITGDIAPDVTLTIVWERDGNFLDSVERTRPEPEQLQLYISEVEEVHQGHYTCRVVLQSPGSSEINLPPVNAGFLTVLDRDRIVSPAIQVIQQGRAGGLQCEYPGALITWMHGPHDVSVSGTFESATFADEGIYTCDVYVHGTSTRVTVMLYVVAPIEILEMSRPVHQNLTNNLPVQFAVDFGGSISADLAITWFHDGIAVAAGDSRIHNTLDATIGRGRTEFRFPLVRRSDVGLYRVVLSNQVGGPGEEPLFASQQEVTFQIDLTVRPSLPENLLVDRVSSRTVHITWTLTNQTPDQAADQLILRVTFANHSLADLLQLAGSTTSVSLDNLIPAQDYRLVLSAVNRDGDVTTNPALFTTAHGSPAFSNLQVERLNRTSFVVTINLAYTGGGAIAEVEVSYRPRIESRLETMLIVEHEHISPLSLRVVVTLTDSHQQQAVEHEAGMELTFKVQVKNDFSFPSSIRTASVSAFVPITTTTSSMPETTMVASPTSILETELLPFWLIAVIASVVTILIMLVIVACVIALCIRCRANKSDRFKVQAPPATTLQAAENGILPADSIAVEQIHARSQSSSVPSINYTPSMDEHYKKHKRELSDGSSVYVGKPPITPSTTASNSPSNFSKSQFLNSQDKGLGSITELGSRGSDDSGTESERDRLRHQQQLQQQKVYQQKLMSASPCSRNNMINSQFVQDGVHCVRGHADGSLCAGSHQSLVSSSHQSIGYSPILCPNTKQLQHVHHHQVPSRRRGGAEYMYSDCESVASTDASCSNLSLSSSQHLRPIQHRSPTPYNHDYPLTEESVV